MTMKQALLLMLGLCAFNSVASGESYSSYRNSGQTYQVKKTIFGRVDGLVIRGQEVIAQTSRDFPNVVYVNPYIRGHYYTYYLIRGDASAFINFVTSPMRFGSWIQTPIWTAYKKLGDAGFCPKSHKAVFMGVTDSDKLITLDCLK
jgi:hypothetical protein